MAENQAHQQSPQPKTETQDPQGRKPAQAIQPSSRSKTPTPDRRRRKPAPLSTFEDNNLVVQIIQKRPLLVVSALCASMLLAAVIAAIGLTHPDNANKIKRESAESATATEKATEKSQTEEKPPLGLYAAIGLGCAAGSWAIVRTLQSPRRRRRRQLSKSLKPRPTPRQQQQKTTSLSRRRVAASRREVAANQQRMAVGETTQERPSGETPPRSSSKSTLADTTDTRRRHSL